MNIPETKLDKIFLIEAVKSWNEEAKLQFFEFCRNEGLA